MTFDDILDQVIALLQRQGRVSYGAMKRRLLSMIPTWKT